MDYLFQDIVEWYLADLSLESKVICATRDIFQARLDSSYRELVVQKHLLDDEIALFTAIMGEIGNNCFDHNFGKWQDAMGCYFSHLWSPESRTYFAILADRGQGVLNSLRYVKPDLKSEEEAVKMAFELKISGRSPEQRGNGLKFVRSVVNGSKHRGLVFYSGKKRMSLGGMGSLEKHLDTGKIETKKGTGTLALIGWKQP